MERIFIDIETRCDVAECSEKDCEHALDFNRSAISVAGIAYEVNGQVVETRCIRDLDELRGYFDEMPDAHIVGHNVIGFDLKKLRVEGIDLRDRHLEDTNLMAVAYTEKVSKEWLEGYEEERKRLNRETKAGHREAGGYSLKTLHPYFCGGEPFWEKKEKDDDEYVMEDVLRTRELFHFFEPRLKDEGTHEFYRKKLIPWALMIHEAEFRGISIDLEKVTDFEQKAELRAQAAKEELDAKWADGYQAYFDLQRKELREKYDSKLDGALSRLKPAKIKDPVKAALRNEAAVGRTRDRYQRLLSAAEQKLEPLNIDSDSQLLWLLKDYMGYDVRTLDAIAKGFKRDSKETHYFNKYKNKDEPVFSTGAQVINRLAAKGLKDMELLSEYKEAHKLLTSFYPSYRRYAHNGVIHCSFNMNGTKTGRLSSSGPNLQQQPAVVKELFVARPGYKLITRDASGIEPLVIAYYTQDPELCSLLIDGRNFHNEVTPIFFPEITVSGEFVKKRHPKERDCAKQCDLSGFYGSEHGMLQITYMKHGYDVPKEVCKERIHVFKERFQSAFEFKEQVLDRALLRGETVTNMCGRRFKCRPEDVRMRGFNRLVQSSASDLVLLSSWKIQEEFEANHIDGRVLLWVHDEIVVEVEDNCVEEAEEIVERCMTNYRLETPYGLLPLKVEGKTSGHWAK